jgi:formate dehydrogenase assembly factor FdhD
MQTFKGKTQIEMVLSPGDMRKLARGYVIHTYSAKHIQKGSEIVACKLELPCTKGYERLGYTLVETLTSKQIRGHRKQIDRRTPAMVTACQLLEQANALLAQTRTTAKGKRQ